MTREFFTTADGCRLEFETQGTGSPVLWQHGLGAPFSQPATVFPKDSGLMRITLACRGHEASDLGDPRKLSIETFADDCLALLDHLGHDRVAVGGISLGAAIALRLAVLHPERVSKLVIARPACVDTTSLATQSIYMEVARIIDAFGVEAGPAQLQALPQFRELQKASPDNAKSAVSYFARPRPDTTVALLSAIPAGSPGLSREQIARVKAPALVIANREDVVHPLAYAEALAGLVPHATLEVITSKTVNAKTYDLEFRAALLRFLA